MLHLPRVLLTAGLLLALAPAPSHAEPIVDLSWDACSPIVSAKQPGSGETVFSMYLSLTGFSDTHTGYATEVFLAGGMNCGTSTTSTPDAWRFDAGGCQGRSLGPITLESNDAACPALAPPGAHPIIDYSRIEDPDYGPIGAMRIVVSAAWQIPQTADPGLRYQLFRMDFHHDASVTGPGTPGASCGGYESPICIALFSGTEPFPAGGGGECNWVVRDTGIQSYWSPTQPETVFKIGQDVLSFGLEPGTAFSCFEAVPAQNATWGAIKAQYR